MACPDRRRLRIFAACAVLIAAAAGLTPVARGQPVIGDAEASVPVTSATGMLRPERLIDMPVESRQGEWLGKIHGTVVSPETGKIAYLIVVRDDDRALFQRMTPVPWADFGVAAATGQPERLVLDTTPLILAGAPMVSDEQSMARADFARQRKIVDSYWLGKFS